jgi:hypothetical protein
MHGQDNAGYFDPSYFEGLSLREHRWAPIPYDQMWSSEFVANLSVVDLIANKGKDAVAFLG